MGFIHMKKIDVALIGAASRTVFGMAGQKLALMLQNHPWFDIAAIVADSPDQVGKRYGEVSKWFWDEDMPSSLSEMRILPADPKEVKKAADVRLAFSALLPNASQEIDPKFASAGIPVVSDSPGFRFEEDVPLFVPEINPEHLKVIEAQRSKRGWEGFIVSCPVCTVTIIALSLKPLYDAFGLKNLFITTLQALSGAGYEGVPSMAIVDNMIPFIGKEEEKVESETPKIFGSVADGKIVPSRMGISSTCTRIGVLHGHTACIFAETEKPVTVEEAARVFKDFRAEPQRLELPSAPRNPIIVREENDRPQPRLDRYSNANGMGVVVGRIRKDGIFERGIKYIVLGHNNVRGTAGNSLLCGEYLYRKGLVE
jgi:aspartate-semialdehyde dehydrogenase